MATTITPNRAAMAILVPRPTATPTAALAPTVKMTRDHPVRSHVGPSAHEEARTLRPSAGRETRTLRPSRGRTVLTLIAFLPRLEVLQLVFRRRSPIWAILRTP